MTAIPRTRCGSFSGCSIWIPTASWVKQLSELASEGLTLMEVQPTFPEVLRYGDEGVAVSTLQYYLAFLGYFLPEQPPVALTGVFDDDTRDAVYTFQSNYGLPVDGIVGRDTWNRLLNVYDQLLRDLPQDYQNYIEQVYPGRFLVLGDEGRAVRQLQENIRKIAAQDPAIPTVEVDGVFGPATQRAVLALQRQQGIDQSGAVGPVLWTRVAELASGL